MTAPTIMLSEVDLALILQIHGHLCPMVLLGARTAKKAHQLATDDGDDSNLFGYYRGYGCAVDGIQIFSGCTWGNSNLVLLRGGSFSLILTEEGSSESIVVTPQPRFIEQIRKDKTSESKSSLMEMFRSAPDEEFLKIETAGDMGILSEFPGD